MSTSEFQEQKDQITMQLTPAQIRRQSIMNIPNMNSAQKANIRDRIFKNNEISAAHARIESRHAGKKLADAK